MTALDKNQMKAKAGMPVNVSSNDGLSVSLNVEPTALDRSYRHPSG